MFSRVIISSEIYLIIRDVIKLLNYGKKKSFW